MSTWINGSSQFIGICELGYLLGGFRLGLYNIHLLIDISLSIDSLLEKVMLAELVHNGDFYFYTEAPLSQRESL